MLIIILAGSFTDYMSHFISYYSYFYWTEKTQIKS